VGGDVAVEMKDVEFSYETLKVLKGVSLEVKLGERIAIMGRSGSGKTTLLKIIAGLLKPEGGFVRVLGYNLMNGSFKNVQGKIAYIPQNLGLVEGGSALYNILLARAPSKPTRFLLGFWDKKDIEEALEALRIVGLESKAMKRVDRLSGGERQRVSVARAIFQGARIILADEPVSNLDRETAESVTASLASLASRGVTIIAVLHDYDLALRFFERVYILKDGKLWELP
jgi:ABC-type phosphate/phosphonate transport system, ATPase component